MFSNRYAHLTEFRTGTMSIFNLRPKTSRKDLFNREEEPEQLHTALEQGYPLVVVLGLSV
ncbi:MAG: hypothetical protein QW096_04825 [Thermofilaceae archaeon]